MIMDLSERAGFDESEPVYDRLSFENSQRLYSFIRSMVGVAVDTQRPMLSQHLIRAFNHHAIVGLHYTAGQYRNHPIAVRQSDGQTVYEPPDAHRLSALMDDFVNSTNAKWVQTDAIRLAADVLWAINHIHPFINGNGRTARAASYYVLCVKVGGLIPGTRTIPELLREPEVKLDYYAALRAADRGNFEPLVELITVQLLRQIATDVPPTPPL